MFKFWLLKKGIEMFGLKDGFEFWFDWEIFSPIQQFIYMNITHKPYCTYHGWHCRKDCSHKKLTTKEKILEYWEEAKKELNTIEKGKNDMCVYCGDEKGTEIIPNPNFDKLSQWLVCKDCKAVVYNQQLYSMGEIIGNEKLTSEAINKLDEIAKKTGKPIMVARIAKGDNGNYNTSSIEFTGKKDGDDLSEI